MKRLSLVMSPLRYPGSKQKVLGKIQPFWNSISNKVYEYREPFLGGASIYLNLNTKGKQVLLNDKDSNIATLFKVIRDNPIALCEKIRDIVPTIKLWSTIRNSHPEDELDIAFRTLFLNRTNYSGILSASPIGGYRQKSEYDIGCRWNAKELIKRIESSSERLKEVRITDEDFFFTIIKPSAHKVFLFVDPPYFKKGNSLYNETMSVDDHLRLRDLLARTEHQFLLTYDNCDEITEMYRDIPGLLFYDTSWNYTTSTVARNAKRPVGKELFITNLDFLEETEENNIGLKKRAF